MFQRVGSRCNAIAKGDVISITATATLKGLRPASVVWPLTETNMMPFRLRMIQ